MIPAQKIASGVLAALFLTGTNLVAPGEVREQQWYLDFLRIERAHEISTGEGVIVGVIDSGVESEHPDLVGRLLPGTNFNSSGRSDGWADDDGHGTAMAGLIAANGRSLGIAPESMILPVRAGGYFRGVNVDEAIDWAVEHGATVLCLAFSGPSNDPVLKSAVARAIAADVVVVAAIGNTPEAGVQYPAAFPGVLGAAGVDRDGEHADISVITPAADLAAPAVDIISPWSRSVIPSGYGSATGTSASTAIIAGVAALVRSRFPDLSAEEVVHRMTFTADDRGSPGRDSTFGWGIVNPVAALTADVPPLHQPASSFTDRKQTSGESSSRLRLLVVGSVVVLLLVVVGALATLRRN